MPRPFLKWDQVYNVLFLIRVLWKRKQSRVHEILRFVKCAGAYLQWIRTCSQNSARICSEYVRVHKTLSGIIANSLLTLAHFIFLQAFSVFFVFIAFTSDMICLLFIPVHWLFFAASTYVWVQFVWHTGKPKKLKGEGNMVSTAILFFALNTYIWVQFVWHIIGKKGS